MIAVRRGYVTAISFTDATGAPWPIGEVLVDALFLPGPAEADGEGSGRPDHLLYLVPAGNAPCTATRRSSFSVSRSPWC